MGVQVAPVTPFFPAMYGGQKTPNSKTGFWAHLADEWRGDVLHLFSY